MSKESNIQVPIIETHDLCKYFKTAKGDLHAVDKVNISIERGKTLGVVGESGCGKSTLGRTLLRLLEPTSGQVLFDGVDIMSYDRHKMKKMREKMQIIFQDPYASLNPRMTVSDLIAEPIRVCGTIKDKRKIDERVFELMETVGLAARFVNTYPHELDGGRRQRIGVARALSVDPQFIVCDEPVSALDVSIQAQILNLMMDLQDSRNLTYMFITHDLSVVKHISSDIAVMYLGQLVEFASTRELFRNPMHPYTQALYEALPKNGFKLTKGHQPLHGEIPNGCPYYDRCDSPLEYCNEKRPNLINNIRCFKYNQEE